MNPQHSMKSIRLPTESNVDGEQKFAFFSDKDLSMVFDFVRGDQLGNFLLYPLDNYFHKRSGRGLLFGLITLITLMQDIGKGIKCKEFFISFGFKNFVKPFSLNNFSVHLSASHNEAVYSGTMKLLIAATAVVLLFMCASGQLISMAL